MLNTLVGAMGAPTADAAGGLAGLAGANAFGLPARLNVGRAWLWPWVFPATRTYKDLVRGQARRHPLHASVLQKAVREAALAAGLSKCARGHTLGLSFATALLEAGYELHPIQALLGHKDVRTAIIYTQVLNRGGLGVRSALDGVPVPRRR